MGSADAGNELIFAKRQGLCKIRAEQGNFASGAVGRQGDTGGQHGRKSYDVVPPERAFDFGQVGFAEVVSIAGRPEIDAANLHIERVFLRRHQQVGTQAAQLAINLVANVGGDGNHGGRHSHAQHDGDCGQHLAPLLSPE